MNQRLKIIDDAVEQSLVPHRPWLAKWLGAVLAKFDAVFDYCYGSKFNPLYRSGTIAVVLFGIVMVTGVYLLLFYDVSAPYESVSRIESSIWLGSLMRAAHRYASDATIAAAVVHFLRILAQGKTWGPQLLAFVSGLALMGLLLFAGFTGYVMVWDVFGRQVAVGGAVLLDALPFFGESIRRSFDGSTTLLSSFFFLNMFMHVALPLFMAFGMYIHTARLARSVWFPHRRLIMGIVAAFALLAVVWPAPLEVQADPFALPTHYVSDLFFGAWIPVARAAPSWALTAALTTTMAVMLLPWLWRPRAKVRRKPSKNNELTCEGCGQCVKDCPYEAIEMVPREAGEGSEYVARVKADHCMTCGVCSASCSRMGIGPPERTGIDQQSAARKFLAQRGNDDKKIVIVGCASNAGGLEWLAGSSVLEKVDVFPLPCAGNLHPFVAQRLLRSYEGLFCWTCPPRNCVFREGPAIVERRLIGGQDPTIPGSIEPGRVCVVGVSGFERQELEREFDAFAARLAGGKAQSKVEPKNEPKFRPARPVLAALMTAGLLASTGALSAVSLPTHAPGSEFLLSFRLAGQAKETCRDLSEAELSSIPIHMQTSGKKCETSPITFQLLAKVDGEPIAEREVRSSGVRGDQPLVVDARVALSPGPHRIEVEFLPRDEDDRSEGISLHFDSLVEFEAGKRRALFYDKTKNSLILKPD